MNSVKKNYKSNKVHISLLLLCSAVFIWSLIKPFSYLLWILEAAPVIAGIIVLIATRKKFQFTNLVYILITIAIIMVLIGARYSYERVPLFNWIKEVYGLKRNHYDRLVHFLQGFIGSFALREILIRKFEIKNNRISGILVLCICLALSALYELMEWAGAMIGGSITKDFLGEQGDRWDTQWDMLLAFVGSIIMVAMFYKVHDKHIRKLLE
jgi:putative membrane protein